MSSDLLAELDAAIQRLVRSDPNNDGEMATEWTLVAALEGVNGAKVDDEGDEVNSYFTAYSFNLKSHAARGLLWVGLDRLT